MKWKVQEQNEQSKVSKIKWRQHEIILVTVTAVAKLIIHLWSIYQLPAIEINMRYAGKCDETKVQVLQSRIDCTFK